MRIVGGTLRGRRFAAPDAGVRPTSDRVREAIFSALQSRGLIIGARVLDAFCGSGAFAFEALSRGARQATLIDESGAVHKVLRKSVRDLGLGAKAELRKADLITSDKAFRETELFDLVFVDPPYAQVGALLPFFERLKSHASDACLVLEQDRRSPFDALDEAGLVVTREAHYGGTLVQFLKFG